VGKLGPLLDSRAGDLRFLELLLVSPETEEEKARSTEEELKSTIEKTKGSRGHKERCRVVIGEEETPHGIKFGKGR